MSKVIVVARNLNWVTIENWESSRALSEIRITKFRYWTTMMICQIKVYLNQFTNKDNKRRTSILRQSRCKCTTLQSWVMLAEWQRDCPSHKPIWRARRLTWGSSQKSKCSFFHFRRRLVEKNVNQIRQVTKNVRQWSKTLHIAWTHVSFTKDKIKRLPCHCL